MIRPEDYPLIGALSFTETGPLPLLPPQSLDRFGILLLVEPVASVSLRHAFGSGTLRLALDGTLAHLLNRRLPPVRSALQWGTVVHAHFRDFADLADASFTCHEITSRLAPSWNRSP